ncbi:RES family NAD+ phosphorylase [Marinomonas algarum]|uniref:RES family NAD+ phosphorylase n=1 Tax=Marinomonas algarum TaxID=2883105 RepID=A0A9X1ILQ1_9GAMM|nr:RES family NAD+ phosphorylase [Marinomonas algarum]MCB5161550.1 RES family NAD+ phosphorylase [Marinomonas algarum]
MTLWRISNFADLKGIGGMRQAGRWHNAGNPIVYLAEHPALALLEIRVHLNVDLEDLPDCFQLLRVDFDDSVLVESLEAGLTLEEQREQSITRRIGDAWLANAQSVLLKVPSVIVPHSYNYLFNPLHPDSKHFSIVDQYQYPFDQRLFQ